MDNMDSMFMMFICIIIVFLRQKMHREDLFKALHRIKPYKAYQLVKYNEMKNDENAFVFWTRMPHSVWITHVAGPLLVNMNVPIRGNRYRSHQIGIYDQILRFSMFLHIPSLKQLSYLFGQDPTTVSRDLKKICKLFITLNEPKHLSLIEIESNEYNNMIGNYNFNTFHSVIYAGDLTVVCIRIYALFVYI